jgi:hypothetical protein
MYQAMSKAVNLKNAFLAFGAIALVLTAWLESASARGRWVARFDLARGHYVVLGYGLPPRGVAEYKQILRERYSVEYRQVALCIVSRSLVSYADAYDQVSAAAIENKFGHDVFKKSWDEADRKWEDKHQAELQIVSHSE